MGFGLCFVGFLALLLDSVGLDFLGYLLVGIGFLKVSKELTGYKGYRVASIAAFACVPVALLSLYSFASTFSSLAELPDIVKTVKAVYLSLLGSVLCMAHCRSTATIAKQGGARLFSARASITAYISALYFAFNVAAVIFGAPGGIAVAVFVCRFLIPLFNAILLFSCFTTITTKAREKKEQEIIKQQTEIIKRQRLLKKRKDAEEDN